MADLEYPYLTVDTELVLSSAFHAHSSSVGTSSGRMRIETWMDSVFFGFEACMIQI
jgi:hypothetical protein